MKYLISFVFLLSLLPFLSVDAKSEDVHQTIDERKQQNFEVRNAMPTLVPNNPAIQTSPDIRSPRDEQTPRDRQAVLCNPKFGGDPMDPGCPAPTPQPSNPPEGGPGPVTQTNPSESSNPPVGGPGSNPGSVVIGLSNTSSGSAFSLINLIGFICLAKGLLLVKKSLLI